MKTLKILILLVLAGLIINSRIVFAQNIPEASKPVCAYCARTIDQINTIGHLKSCPYFVAKGPTSGSTSTSVRKSVPSGSNSNSNTVAKGIIQGVISDILSSDQARKQAEFEARQKEMERNAIENAKQKQIDAEIEKERHNKVMKLYQPLPISSNPTPVDLSGVDLSGKSVFSDKTVPVMGGSPMSQEDRERQALIDKFGPNYVDQINMYGLKDIPKDGIDSNQSPSWDENSKEYKLANLMKDNIAKHPLGKLPAYIASQIMSVGKNVFSYLDEARDAVANGAEEEISNNNPNPLQRVFMGVINEGGNKKLDEVKDNATSVLNGKIVDAGGKGMTYINGEKGEKDYRTTLNVISDAVNIKNNLQNLADWWVTLTK